MTTQNLLDRAYGNTPHHVFQRTISTRLVYALQPYPSINFAQRAPSISEIENDPHFRPPAHPAGVNALAIDRFEGRYLLTGGADSSLAIWDLESPPHNSHPHAHGHTSHSTANCCQTQTPLLTLPRSTPQGSPLGITALRYYPFDSLAFLTSSYDHHVRFFASETLVESASWDLGSVVYSLDVSPIAQHLLVACATQREGVRLVDLRSGDSAQSLVADTGKRGGGGGGGGGGGEMVLSCAWSPNREWVVASGGADGRVWLWDVRMGGGKGRGVLGGLDLEDGNGVSSKFSVSSRSASSTTLTSSSSLSRSSILQRASGYNDGGGEGAGVPKLAHHGPVNGLTWTASGSHIITSGHDARIRVWDAASGANTLVNFGPSVRNSVLASCTPLLAPPEAVVPGADVLFHANDHEILMFDMWEGRVLRRLRRPHTIASSAVSTSSTSASEPSSRPSNKKAKSAPTAAAKPPRVTGLAWRAHDVEMYSAHADGAIGVWKPRTEEDVVVEEDEEEERKEKEVGRKRKRDMLDEIYRGFVGGGSGMGGRA